MYALAVQSRMLDAVEAAQLEHALRPVNSDRVLAKLGAESNPNTRRELSRTLTLVARLAPDALGRRLVFAGRMGTGYTWMVNRG